MSVCRSDEQLYLIGIREKRYAPDLQRLTFRTNRGEFDALSHFREGITRGVIMLGGANGGFDGPSRLYRDLSERLCLDGIAVLRLDYRVPRDCAQCGIDALLALQYLDDEAVRKVVLVGWSFGGAVAIATGSVARTVCGVATIATASTAGGPRGWLRTKPILLLHGDADNISPVEVSRQVYAEADENRRMIVYPGTGHDIREARDAARNDLTDWILTTLK